MCVVVDDPRRFRRAALRWHAHYCAEVPDVGFEEAHAVLACLAGLAGATTEACGGGAGRARPSAGARAGERDVCRLAPARGSTCTGALDA
jgi:hypothetical protein